MTNYCNMQIYENTLSLIARKISRAINESKIKKVELGKKTGLTRAQILSVEKGDANYTIDTLLKLANALNLRIVIKSNNEE